MSKMKRVSFAGIVALIVCLSFCFGMIPVAAVTADVTVGADAITVMEGEENVYELTVWGDGGTPFTSYQVSLTLPDFARVDAVEALTNGAGDVFVGRGHDNVAAATLSSNVAKTGKVALFAVRFTATDAEAGRYAVTAGTLRVTNASAAELNAEFATGYIEVVAAGARAKGDWNGDGRVTLTDVMSIQQFIVNTMLGNAGASSAQIAAADVDNNGRVDIVDCQYIQRYIIGAIDSLDNIGGHGSDDKEVVGIQAYYTGGEIPVGDPIPYSDIEVYLCYSDQSVARTYDFSIGDYDQTQAGTISVPVCCGKFSTEITVTFYKPAPALEGTYTGEAGTLKLYYNAQYDMHVFGLQLNGVADEISGLFEQDDDTLYLADRTNWCDLYVVTVNIADRTFTLDKTCHFNEQGDVDYDDWQGTYTVAEDGSSIWLGQYGGFMRFEYDESGQVNTAIYTGTYDMGDGAGTAYVFGTGADDCMLAVDFWITDTQDRVISLEPPTFYQVQFFFYVDGELYRSPTATAPEGTSYSELASWAAGFFCDMYPGDLNAEWDLVYPEGVTGDTLVEDGATVSLYFTTSVAVTYDMEVTFYVNDEPVLTQTFEATAGSLYINTATEAAELFIGELYDDPLSDNWIPVYAEGVTNNTTVTGNDAFSLYFETPVYRVNLYIYVDGELFDDQRYVTAPATHTYGELAEFAAGFYLENTTLTLTDEWDVTYPEGVEPEDRVIDGSLVKLYFNTKQILIAVADDLNPELYPVLHFEEDGTIGLYNYDGTLIDATFDTYTTLEQDGRIRAYVTGFGTYMISDEPYVVGEGDNALSFTRLVPFRHEAEEECLSFVFDFTVAAYRFDCYPDGFVDVYYRANAEEDEFAFVGSDTYTLNADDNTLFTRNTLYAIGENNDLYIAVPETGFLFETPFPLWQDNTTLAVYDNGMAYRIYKGESVVAAIPWTYETANVILLPEINFRYFRWEIDGQWHFVANYNDVAEWDNTVYNNNGADLTVYTSDDGKTVIVYDGERATYGEINGNVLFRYDYHNDVDCFILQEDNAWHAATRNPIKHKYRLSNESAEIFEYTGELFFSDEREGEPRYAAIVGLKHLPTFDLLFTCTLEDDLYCLSHDGVELINLVFNAEQGVYYISAIDDLQHAVNVRFVKDDETVQTTINAILFQPLVSGLIGRPAMLPGDATNYIVTGVYTDEACTEAVADDYIFSDAEGALLFYLTVAECTTEDIIGTAYGLEEGEYMEHPVILTGTVTGIQTEYSTYYHNVNVFITVEGCEKYPILCYRLAPLYSDISGIAVGDVVTVEGIIKNYRGTIEFDAGCLAIDYQPAD